MEINKITIYVNNNTKLQIDLTSRTRDNLREIVKILRQYTQYFDIERIDSVGLSSVFSLKQYDSNGTQEQSNININYYDYVNVLVFQIQNKEKLQDDNIDITISLDNTNINIRDFIELVPLTYTNVANQSEIKMYDVGEIGVEYTQNNKVNLLINFY